MGKAVVDLRPAHSSPTSFSERIHVKFSLLNGIHHASDIPYALILTLGV